MSFFSSFKKALGFPDEYDDLDDLSDLEDADTADSDTSGIQESSAQKDEDSNVSVPDSGSHPGKRYTDTVAELNDRIRELEAEHEQLRLENKSMANKLRGRDMPVVGVNHTTDPGNARLAEENKRLTSELKQVKLRLAKSEQDITDRDSIISELRSRNMQLTDRVRNAEEKESQARTETDSIRTEMHQAKENSDKEINTLTQKVESLRAEVKRLNTLLQASDAASGVLPLAASDEAPYKPHSGKKRRQRRKPKDVTANGSPTPDGGNVKISAIDELMDNTDWFIAAEPGPRPKDPDTEENFGYREPVRKTSKTNSNKNQLTLF
ncbi:MAG: hypothetical protein NC043_08540 [Muribaculaceae bacterium]|nr:hypothetical protein [Muribaculaceae bacterium]